MKSESARLALKGIRQISRVAFFATADPKSESAWSALTGIRRISEAAFFAA